MEIQEQRWHLFYKLNRAGMTESCYCSKSTAVTSTGSSQRQKVTTTNCSIKSNDLSRLLIAKFLSLQTFNYLCSLWGTDDSV
jgi:hypothetical protein